jgi:hypothetical protein
VYRCKSKVIACLNVAKAVLSPELTQSYLNVKPPTLGG